MGVTLHYKGSINQKSLISALVDEVSDICDSINWDYEIFDESWDIPADLVFKYDEQVGDFIYEGHAGLKGITFKPHEDCDYIHLTVDKFGHLNSPPNIAIKNKEKDKIGTIPALNVKKSWIHTKTQFAGVEAHIAIVNLLKYLKGKYFQDLKVKDDGKYWEEGNTALLAKRMEAVFKTLSALEDGIAVLNNLDDLTEEKLLDTIKNVLDKLSDEEDISVKILKVDAALSDFKNIDDLFKEADLQELMNEYGDEIGDLLDDLENSGSFELDRFFDMNRESIESDWDSHEKGYDNELDSFELDDDIFKDRPPEKPDTEDDSDIPF